MQPSPMVVTDRPPVPRLRRGSAMRTSRVGGVIRRARPAGDRGTHIEGTAMTDLLLAIAHHVLIFAIFGVLCGEFLLVRPGLTAATARRVATLDLVYGVCAGLVVIVGFSRAHFAAKGWDYYTVNWCF